MVAIVPNKELKELNGRFLYLFFQRSYISIRSLGRGANQPALDTNLINNFPFVLPPFSEQIKITEFLNSQENKLTLAQQKIEKAIALLKEYRTALITNAVTGKIDVRSVPLPTQKP